MAAEREPRIPYQQLIGYWQRTLTEDECKHVLDIVLKDQSLYEEWLLVADLVREGRRQAKERENARNEAETNMPQTRPVQAPLPPVGAAAIRDDAVARPACTGDVDPRIDRDEASETQRLRQLFDCSQQDSLHPFRVALKGAAEDSDVAQATGVPVVEETTAPRPVPRRDQVEAPATSTYRFTLVELLVVVMVLGVLTSLSLPAIQGARECARHSQCADNLNRIGSAMQMHHDVLRVLPFGHKIPAPPFNANQDFGDATWIFAILPYMDGNAAVYALADQRFGFGSAPPPPSTTNNAPVVRTELSAFECPTNNRVNDVLWFRSYTRGSYVANNGLGPMAEWVYIGPGSTASLPTTRVPGVFYVNSQTRFSDFHDGTANTALCSEIRVVLGGAPNGDQRGVMFYPEGPLYHHNNTPNSMIPDGVRAATCVNDLDVPCVGTYTAWNNRSLTMTARSYHPGGVNVVFGDGNVRFVSDRIDLAIWRAFCTPKAIADEASAGGP